MNKKANISGNPEYSCWMGAQYRCNKPSIVGYENYGGRGIKFHAAWQDFWTFLRDVGPRPSKAHTLDRIDVNGNYEPGNVQWATRKEQSGNRQNSVFVKFGDETLCRNHAAEKAGIPKSTLRKRLDHGWDAQRALDEKRVNGRETVPSGAFPRGVYKHHLSSLNPYCARIRNKGGKRIHLGNFSTPEEAGAAYQDARKRMDEAP